MTDGQFYGAILWHHFMAPFYGACVLGLMFISNFNYVHAATWSSKAWVAVGAQKP